MEDLVHLERRRERFDQDGDLDGAAIEAEPFLGEFEYVAPQRGFVAAFQLGQIEIGA
jgi:hypothetical protein